LAHIANIFAHHGLNPVTGQRFFSKEFARYVNATLATCGMYDGSGEFAVRVGIPSKSGVGGGILAVVEKRMGIGIYGPALDEKGNSIAGQKMLEYLSKTLNLHMFASEL
jgi:glutaminase